MCSTLLIWTAVLFSCLRQAFTEEEWGHLSQAKAEAVLNQTADIRLKFLSAPGGDFCKYTDTETTMHLKGLRAQEEDVMKLLQHSGWTECTTPGKQCKFCIYHEWQGPRPQSSLDKQGTSTNHLQITQYHEMVLSQLAHGQLTLTKSLLSGILNNIQLQNPTPDIITLAKNVVDLLNTEMEVLPRIAFTSRSPVNDILKSILSQEQLSAVSNYQTLLFMSSFNSVKRLVPKNPLLLLMKQDEYPADVIRARNRILSDMQQGLLPNSLDLGHVPPDEHLLALLAHLTRIDNRDLRAPAIHVLYSHFRLKYYAMHGYTFVPSTLVDIAFLLNSFLTERSPVLIREVYREFTMSSFPWQHLVKDMDFSVYSSPRILFIDMLKVIVKHPRSMRINDALLLDYFVNAENAPPSWLKEKFPTLTCSACPIVVEPPLEMETFKDYLSCDNYETIVDSHCLIESITNINELKIIFELIKNNPANIQRYPYQKRKSVILALLTNLANGQFKGTNLEKTIKEDIQNVVFNNMGDAEPTFHYKCPDDNGIMPMVPTLYEPTIEDAYEPCCAGGAGAVWPELKPNASAPLSEDDETPPMCIDDKSETEEENLTEGDDSGEIVFGSTTQTAPIDDYDEPSTTIEQTTSAPLNPATIDQESSETSTKKPIWAIPSDLPEVDSSEPNCDDSCEGYAIPESQTDEGTSYETSTLIPPSGDLHDETTVPKAEITATSTGVDDSLETVTPSYPESQTEAETNYETSTLIPPSGDLHYETADPEAEIIATSSEVDGSMEPETPSYSTETALNGQTCYDDSCKSETVTNPTSNSKPETPTDDTSSYGESCETESEIEQSCEDDSSAKDDPRETTILDQNCEDDSCESESTTKTTTEAPNVEQSCEGGSCEQDGTNICENDSCGAESATKPAIETINVDQNCEDDSCESEGTSKTTTETPNVEPSCDDGSCEQDDTTINGDQICENASCNTKSTTAATESTIDHQPCDDENASCEQSVPNEDIMEEEMTSMSTVATDDELSLPTTAPSTDKSSSEHLCDGHLCEENVSDSISSEATDINELETDEPVLTPTTEGTIVSTTETSTPFPTTEPQPCDTSCEDDEVMMEIIKIESLWSALCPDAPKAPLVRKKANTVVIKTEQDRHYQKGDVLKTVLNTIRERVKKRKVIKVIDQLLECVLSDGSGLDSAEVEKVCLPADDSSEGCADEIQATTPSLTTCPSGQMLLSFAKIDSLFSAIPPFTHVPKYIQNKLKTYLVPADKYDNYRKGELLRVLLLKLKNQATEFEAKHSIDTLIKIIMQTGPALDPPELFYSCQYASTKRPNTIFTTTESSPSTVASSLCPDNEKMIKIVKIESIWNALRDDAPPAPLIKEKASSYKIEVDSKEPLTKKKVLMYILTDMRISIRKPKVIAVAEKLISCILDDGIGLDAPETENLCVPIQQLTTEKPKSSCNTGETLQLIADTDSLLTVLPQNTSEITYIREKLQTFMVRIERGKLYNKSRLLQDVLLQLKEISNDALAVHNINKLLNIIKTVETDMEPPETKEVCLPYDDDATIPLFTTTESTIYKDEDLTPTPNLELAMPSKSTTESNGGELTTTENSYVTTGFYTVEVASGESAGAESFTILTTSNTENEQTTVSTVLQEYTNTTDGTEANNPNPSITIEGSTSNAEIELTTPMAEIGESTTESQRIESNTEESEPVTNAYYTETAQNLPIITTTTEEPIESDEITESTPTEKEEPATDTSTFVVTTDEMEHDASTEEVNTEPQGMASTTEDGSYTATTTEKSLSTSEGDRSMTESTTEPTDSIAEGTTTENSASQLDDKATSTPMTELSESTLQEQWAVITTTEVDELSTDEPASTYSTERTTENSESIASDITTTTTSNESFSGLSTTVKSDEANNCPLNMKPIIIIINEDIYGLLPEKEQYLRSRIKKRIVLFKNFKNSNKLQILNYLLQELQLYEDQIKNLLSQVGEKGMEIPNTKKVCIPNGYDGQYFPPETVDCPPDGYKITFLTTERPLCENSVKTIDPEPLFKSINPVALNTAKNILNIIVATDIPVSSYANQKTNGEVLSVMLTKLKASLLRLRAKSIGNPEEVQSLLAEVDVLSDNVLVDEFAKKPVTVVEKCPDLCGIDGCARASSPNPIPASIANAIKAPRRKIKKTKIIYNTLETVDVNIKGTKQGTASTTFEDANRLSELLLSDDKTGEKDLALDMEKIKS